MWPFGSKGLKIPVHKQKGGWKAWENKHPPRQGSLRRIFMLLGWCIMVVVVFVGAITAWNYYQASRRPAPVDVDTLSTDDFVVMEFSAEPITPTQNGSVEFTWTPGPTKSPTPTPTGAFVVRTSPPPTQTPRTVERVITQVVEREVTRQVSIRQNIIVTSPPQIMEVTRLVEVPHVIEVEVTRLVEVTPTPPPTWTPEIFVITVVELMPPTMEITDEPD